MLFSCSKENDDRSQEKTKNVVVQFAPASLTRATEGTVTNTDVATFSNYAIYFLDAADNVVEGTVTGTSKPTEAVVCPAVGKTAVSVYVVAYTGSDINLSGITANSSTLADIKATYAAMSTQTTIANVVLANSSKTGNGKIISSTPNTYTAAVEIAPVICRLEIGKICGTGDITGFKLEGIYIDGHAVNFNVGGGYDKTVTDASNNITAGIYSIGVDNGKLSGYPSTFCDVAQITAIKDGSNPKYIAAPSDSKVWAYQLAAGAPMPKIIVKLSAVNGGSETKYVTVNSYKNIDNSDAVYTQLVAGTVYKINEISFEVKNTAEVPNATEKNVSVTVTVKAWDVVNLKPEV